MIARIVDTAKLIRTARRGLLSFLEVKSNDMIVHIVDTAKLIRITRLGSLSFLEVKSYESG